MIVGTSATVCAFGNTKVAGRAPETEDRSVPIVSILIRNTEQKAHRLQASDQHDILISRACERFFGKSRCRADYVLLGVTSCPIRPLNDLSDGLHIVLVNTFFPFHLDRDFRRQKRTVKTRRGRHENVGIGSVAVVAPVILYRVTLVSKSLLNGLFKSIPIPALHRLAKRLGGCLEGIIYRGPGQVVVELGIQSTGGIQ